MCGREGMPLTCFTRGVGGTVNGDEQEGKMRCAQVHVDKQWRGTAVLVYAKSLCLLLPLL